MDFNGWEFLVLVILAVLLFGPDKIPELARGAARLVIKAREFGQEARGKLKEELGPGFADIGLADLNPKGLINKVLLNPEITGDLDDVKQALHSVDAAVREQPIARWQPDEEATSSGDVAPFDNEAT